MKQFIERFKTPIVGVAIILAIFIIKDQRLTIEKYKASEGMLQGGDIAKAEYIDSLQHVIDSLSLELLNLK